MKMILLAAAAALAAGPALANCVLSETPCYTDSYGNTYRTEQNLGGGYNTYRNGTLNSQTSQDAFSGSYIRRYDSGRSETYPSDPYQGSFGQSRQRERRGITFD